MLALTASVAEEGAVPEATAAFVSPPPSLSLPAPCSCEDGGDDAGGGLCPGSAAAAAAAAGLSWSMTAIRRSKRGPTWSGENEASA